VTRGMYFFETRGLMPMLDTYLEDPNPLIGAYITIGYLHKL